MIGACSRSCCSAIYSVANYSMIEKEVEAASKQLSPPAENNVHGSSMIEAKCQCGNIIQLAKMYQGTYRKCPKCNGKLLVPLNG
jgi:DNA-directed RNA polymerase subunit RPC12/RpoP